MSLFGSGSTTQTTNTTNFTASLNPQLDLEGSGAGAQAVNISPLSQAGSIGSIYSEAEDYYAPVSIVATGDNLGDAALNNLSNILTQQGAIQSAGAGQTQPDSAVSSTISSLFSGSNVYWLIGGFLFLLLTTKKG